jgi:hypothetical protein
MKDLPESIEAFISDGEVAPMIHQNIPRPTLKNILFKEAPEMKDKEKAKSKYYSRISLCGSRRALPF